MAMDREALMSIMQALPESALLKGLSAAGVNLDDSLTGGGVMDGMDQTQEDNAPLIPWNRTDVKIPAATDRPKIWDMNQIEDQPQPGAQAQAGKKPAYYDQDQPDGNMAAFSAATMPGS